MTTGTAIAVIAPQRRDLAVIEAELAHHRATVLAPLEAELAAEQHRRKGENYLHLVRAHLALQAIGELMHASLTAAHHVVQGNAMAMQHQHAMNMAVLQSVAAVLANRRQPVPYEPPPPPRLSAAQVAELRRVPMFAALYHEARSDPSYSEISDPAVYRIVIESLNDAIAEVQAKKKKRRGK